VDALSNSSTWTFAVLQWSLPVVVCSVWSHASAGEIACVVQVYEQTSSYGGFEVRRRSVYLVIALCVTALVLHGVAEAARTVTGTVMNSLSSGVSVKPDGDGQVLLLKPKPGAAVMRGQAGVELRKASLCDFAPGDRIVAVVDQNNQMTSAKAFYAVTKGTLSMRNLDRLFLKDGRFVKLAPGARVVLSTGKVGKLDDLKPGSSLICRLNPSTEQAWMVVATKAPPPSAAQAKTTTEVKVAPVTIPAKSSAKVKGFSEVVTAPAYPRAKSGEQMPTVTVTADTPSRWATPGVNAIIESVTYVAPSPLKARDWMRVELNGTPGGRAICEVKGLIPRTVMKEASPGHYRASVMVPSGKFVRNQPVLGHLTVSGVDAPTVQASTLITVDAPAPEPVTLPEPVVAEAPTPAPEPVPEPAAEVAPAPVPGPAPVVEQPKPQPPKVKAPVAVTSPAMGARILRTLVVTGSAEPTSHVMVTVSYSNDLGGLLNLSGQVSSQLVAVDANGRFQMGPIALEGPLATRGLVFTVRACYPESEDQAVVVRAYGDRS